MIGKILACTHGFRGRSVLTSAFVMAETLLEVLIPFLMMKIVDVGIATADIGYVVRYGLLMLGAAFASLFFGILAGRFAAVAATGVARNVRSRLFGCIQAFSFANIDRFSTASLITRMTIDVTNTQLAYMMTIRLLVRAPVMMIAATVMAIRINASLATVFLVAIPLLALALLLIMKAAYPRFGVMLEKYDAMNAQVQEKLTAIRVIKAFVREKYECENFNEAARALQFFQKKAEKTMILNMPVMMIAMYGCTLAVLWFGGLQIVDGTMDEGALFSFIGYVSQILISLMMISMAFLTIVISRASIKRITEVFDEIPDIRDNAGEDAPEMADGSILFEDVSFSYNKDMANLHLQGISFNIPSGETVGIVGGTGSGKTTLVQLIPRLYDVTAGRVLVGGHDVREYPLQELRSNVAMVLQNNELFSGTIAENLRWGKADATEEELREACRVAQAHDFIMSFPDGYDTMLVEGGANLSGGQKQRLCIARALLAKPKIIIMDDSTSAVDTATDAAIRAGFAASLGDVTTIIIAQRLASVMEADKILVMDDGHLVAAGKHEELLENCPMYAEVYSSQQRGDA